MKCTYRSPHVVVFDDVLDPEAFQQLWTYFQYEDLAPVTQTEGAWRLDDGRPMAGPEFFTPTREEQEDGTFAPNDPSVYPTGSPVDHVLGALLDVMDDISPPVGDDWHRVAGRSYVYPTGSALSWHSDDTDYFAGAFVYYAHPRWDAQWGGALLLAHHEDPGSLPMVPGRFDSGPYSEALMDPGLGTFILPKPNRLIVLGALPHMVTHVTKAAGQNVRASLAGFFVRREPGDDMDDASDMDGTGAADREA